MSEPLAPPTLPRPSLRVAREIGRGGAAGGRLLLLTAGLHGNEPAGVLALQRVFARLAVARYPLAGLVVGLAGNRGALAAGERYLGRDLNRLWLDEVVDHLLEGAPPATPEERELLELDAALTAALAACPGPRFFLDLHTTSGEGPPFAILDDVLRNRRLALALPVPAVLGLEEELAGTLLFRLSALGIASVALEAGRHTDPDSVDRAEAAVWISLETAGLLARGTAPEAATGRRLLEASARGVPHVVEVRHRHRLAADDDFRMLPGRRSFQPVARGERLATDRRGEVRAPFAGLLLMPLYQPQGEEGFFLARAVRPWWLALSGALRRVRGDRLLALLPGVRRDARFADAFAVDRRVARFLVRELFHLLGYRRTGEYDQTILFQRRQEDPDAR